MPRKPPRKTPKPADPLLMPLDEMIRQAYYEGEVEARRGPRPMRPLTDEGDRRVADQALVATTWWPDLEAAAMKDSDAYPLVLIAYADGRNGGGGSKDNIHLRDPSRYFAAVGPMLRERFDQRSAADRARLAAELRGPLIEFIESASLADLVRLSTAVGLPVSQEAANHARRSG